jgi:hypothetical protein
VTRVSDSPVPDVELEPAQPAEVARAIAELLRPEPEPDPWWQSGIDLETDS